MMFSVCGRRVSVVRIVDCGNYVSLILIVIAAVAFLESVSRGSRRDFQKILTSLSFLDICLLEIISGADDQ